MSTPHRLVKFDVDDRQFALPLDAVERVLRAVEVTPLPVAPHAVIGVVNVHGKLLPVVSLRRRCGLPDRAVEPIDQIAIVKSSTRTVALVVDAAEVIDAPADDLLPVSQVVPGAGPVRAVLKRSSGLVLVYEADALLSLEDETVLETALQDLSLEELNAPAMGGTT